MVQLEERLETPYYYILKEKETYHQLELQTGHSNKKCPVFNYIAGAKVALFVISRDWDS
jgi:hypothetical protein